MNPSSCQNHITNDFNFDGKFSENITDEANREGRVSTENFIYDGCSNNKGYKEKNLTQIVRHDGDQNNEFVYGEDFCGQENVDFNDALQPLSERWSPVGANYDDAISHTSDLPSPNSELELLNSDSHDNVELFKDSVAFSRVKNLEEEQELLTSSLMALTSHFAHVQLRVRQIVEAPTHERDQLLKDLEEFAFRGIPDKINNTSNFYYGNGLKNNCRLKNYNQLLETKADIKCAITFCSKKCPFMCVL